MTDNNHRDFSDRREYDIGYVIKDGKRVNRRVSERRESDKFRKRLKDLFELHMKDTVADDFSNIIDTILQKLKIEAFI